MEDLPKFEKWDSTELVAWAYMTYVKMQQMSDKIQRLTWDHKDAVRAYEDLQRKQDDWK